MIILSTIMEQLEEINSIQRLDDLFDLDSIPEVYEGEPIADYSKVSTADLMKVCGVLDEI